LWQLSQPSELRERATRLQGRRRLRFIDYAERGGVKTSRWVVRVGAVVLAGLAMAVFLARNTSRTSVDKPVPDGGAMAVPEINFGEQSHSNISAADIDSQRLELSYPSFSKSVREIEQLVASGESLSPADTSDVLSRLRFCRGLTRRSRGEGYWQEAATTLCDGTGLDASFDIAKADQELFGSDEITTIDLARERSARGHEAALESADAIVRLSMDPAELQAAMALLVHMNQSIGVRLGGRDLHAARQLELEALSVSWYRCALRGSCDAQAFETVRYCLHARCNRGVSFAVALQETLSARDFSYVLQLRQFLGLGPPRPVPAALPLR